MQTRSLSESVNAVYMTLGIIATSFSQVSKGVILGGTYKDVENVT